jgi:hydroxypyruvate reductase
MRRVTILVGCARAALDACGGERLVRATAGRERARVWAIGKAAGAMARGAAQLADGGLVIARTGDARLAGSAVSQANQGRASAEPSEADGWAPGLELHEAPHPFPDERSVRACEALLDDARTRRADERVLLLISGGGSSLLSAPLDGVTLAELQADTRALVLGGAAIGEINTVRRHLGRAFGGRLAAACSARIEALVLSDVLGDDPAAIASGPVSPDPTTLDDARAIATRYGLDARRFDGLPETHKPGDPEFARVTWRILANARTLRDEAARAVAATGLCPRVEEAPLEGDVTDCAKRMEAAFSSLAAGEVLIATGEPTVRVHGDGVGGRAQHLALMLALRLRDSALVVLGSDGSDGPTPAAGAALDSSTLPDRAAAADALERFDSHPLLAAANATLVTGPTGTNLGDLLLLARRA